MSRQKNFIFLLVVIWVALFAASFFFSTQIEGPRNIDTGFQRLDVLARYQFIAFAVAVVSAVLGIVWRRASKWTMLAGLMPLIITGLLIAGIFVATIIFNPTLSPEEAYQPPKQTTLPIEEPATD